MALDEGRYSKVDLVLPDEGATAGLAKRVAGAARPGDVFALSGDLGAGKTTFARAFVAAAGGGEEVPSPTFTLVQTYRVGAGMIWHFDLYRIEDPEEAYELGIEDAFRSGISLVEWPDRLDTLLPDDRLDLVFRIGRTGSERLVQAAGHGSWADRMAVLHARG